MIKQLFPLLLLLTVTTLSAQVSVNQDNSAPDPSAMLDVKSSDKGVLLPRMTTTERDAISDPADGLLIYNTTDSCFNYFAGGKWYKDCGRDPYLDNTKFFPQSISSTGGAVEGYGITSDDAGNIYVTGFFNGTAGFGNTQLSATGSNDVFLAKYTINGDVVWAKKLDMGGSFESGIDVAVDGQGYVWLAGNVTTSTIKLFIAKYDGQGNPQWLMVPGSPVNDPNSITGIDTDQNGNAYITGSFRGELSIGASLTTNLASDAYFGKIDPDGNFFWAKKTDASLLANGADITTDDAGNSYIAGGYQGTITLDGHSISSTSGNDAYLLKIDPSGAVVWAGSGGGAGDDQGSGVGMDAGGNIYLAGIFSGSASFGGENTSTTDGDDVFLVKYNSTGTVQWVRNSNGSNGSTINEVKVAATSDGVSYLSGAFSATLGFGSKTIVSDGIDDAFMAQYDTDGNVQWAVNGGGNRVDQGKGVCTNTLGNGFATGFFSSETASFSGQILTTGFNTEAAFVWGVSKDGEQLAFVPNTNGNLSDTQDLDSDPTNELQHLELNGSVLSISGGNSVDLSNLPNFSGITPDGQKGLIEQLLAEFAALKTENAQMKAELQSLKTLVAKLTSNPVSEKK